VQKYLLEFGVTFWHVWRMELALPKH